MIANGVSKFFTSFSLQLAIARFTLFILKKIALCRSFVLPEKRIIGLS